MSTASIKEMENLKAWVLDGLTTMAFQNKSTFMITLHLMCTQYLVMNDATAKSSLEVLSALDDVFKRVNEEKAKTGHPARRWER